MKGTTKNNVSKDPHEREPRRHTLQVIIVSTLAVIAIFVLLSVVSEAESFSVRGNIETKPEETLLLPCCQHKEAFDPKALLEKASAKKNELLVRLKDDYGEYFEAIFLQEEENNHYRPIRPSTPQGPSLDRLKRKLMIKVLSKHYDFHTKDDNNDIEENNKNNCDCSVSSKYVWATGGHSAAAGHGNLYNESYTAYMEADVKDIFEASGIEFEARNYAMGGHRSAPGTSMCFREIYGDDVDFFSWDFGMTDGRDPSKLFHYVYRGGRIKTRPAAMVINNGGRAAGSRIGALQDLETMGMATFHFDESDATSMREAIPDSEGLSAEELQNLPDYVRNHKCGNAFEKGDPYCSAEKYSKWGCEKRLKQASWHPGFKEMAFVGHGVGLFLVETLMATLQDLVEKEAADQDFDRLYQQLLEEDLELHHNFTSAEIPENVKTMFQVNDLPLATNESKVDPDLFFKGNSLCHTAELPSRTRYQGILTDTDQVGEPAPYGNETYYVGVEKFAAGSEASPNGKIRLVYEMHKEREVRCKGVLIKPDYADTFYVNPLDDWAKLTLPNPAEKRAYGPEDGTDFEGIIILILKLCDYGKCPQGFLTPLEDHASNNWEMKINGMMVTKVVDLGGGAIIVGSSGGFRFPPNESGQYEIEIQVNQPRSYFAVSNFVLY